MITQLKNENKKGVKATMYKFTYELSKDDYIDFNMHHSKASPSIRKTFISLRFIIPILFIIFPLVFPLLIKSEVEIAPIAIFVIIAMLWILIFPRFFWKDMEKRICKIVDESDNGDLFKSRTVKISDMGIEEILYNGTNTRKWSAVTKIDESVKSMFIYFSAVEAAIIPKKLFEDENALQKFRDFSKKHL